jgi:hypothetical protein
MKYSDILLEKRKENGILCLINAIFDGFGAIIN